MTPTLETTRLILRPLAITDAPAIQRYFNNWNIIKNMGAAVPWPYPDDGALTFLRDRLLPSVAREEAHAWAITLKPSDECVGVITFRLHDHPDKGNRGFWLAEHLWGRRLMTEATGAVNDFVFDVLGFESFGVSNAHFNTASSAIKRSSGAELIGLVDKTGPDGTIRKSEIWRLTREGWKAAKFKN